MKYFYLICMVMICALRSMAQGCSDAGFCSLGALKNNVDSVAKNQINIGVNYGFGEQNTNIVNAYVEYSLKLNNRLVIQTKVTAANATGFLGSAFGIGDFYASVNYTAKTKANCVLNFIGGIKIPFTNGNYTNQTGKPLPLAYQPGLGTYDAIIGVNYIVNKHWEFDAGLQLPLIQINKNTFFPSLYVDERALGFSPTHNFSRNSDVLGRLGYYIQASPSLIFKPSLLAIYHVANDTYDNNLGSRLAILGSQGITLNASLAGTKRFKNGNSLELLMAAPFVSRKARPDGLTRHLVLNMQYNIHF